MIAPASIQNIRETARIEEVVGEFVRLKRAGSTLKGNCPFHNEKTPSFVVTPQKNIFKCFGCGKGGDSISFVMEHEKYSYVEALEFLAQKYNIKVEYIKSEHAEEIAQERLEQESLYIANSFAAVYYHQNLFDTEEGRTIGLSYFKERGFSDTTIKKFQLGYALKSGDAFTNKAVLNGYSIDILKKLGLTNSYNKDFFKERVQFVIHNAVGKVVAFAGRILTNDKQAPKYVNSPETDIYHKSKVLYGLFFAKNAILKNDVCYLVEGYTDVISMHQAGVENVVASSGTSLTVEQIRLIKRYTQNLVILYDGDEAGIKAALRGSDMALEEDMNLKVVLIPDGHDPDSFVRQNGAQFFIDFVEKNAQDFLLFKTNHLSKNIQHDPIKKAELARSLTETIAKIPDTFKRQIYIKQCAQIMQLAEQQIISEVNKQLRNKLKKENKISDSEKEDLANIAEEAMAHTQEKPLAFYTDIKERDIVRIIIEFGNKPYDESRSIAQYVVDELKDKEIYLENNLYQLIVEIADKRLQENKLVDMDFYLQHPNKNVQSFAVQLASNPHEISPNWWSKFEIIVPTREQNALNDLNVAMNHFLLDKIKQKIKENQQAMQVQHDDEEVMYNQVRIHQHLTDLRKMISDELGIIVS